MKDRLLITHCDAELLDVFARFLTAQDYDVETSTNGLDCVAKLRQVTPAVLVLDLDLLWGGGDGVLAWLRDERPATTISVLLTGTVPAPPEMAEFDQSPVVHYLPKPFALSTLLDSIRSAVAKSGFRAPSTLERTPRGTELLISSEHQIRNDLNLVQPK